MSDENWINAAAFTKSFSVDSDAIIAPEGFEVLLPCVTYARRHECQAPKVVVLHKGQLEALGVDWIDTVTRPLHPSFANEVFVVFTENRPMRSLTSSHHFKALKKKLAVMVKPDVVAPSTSRNRLAVYVGDHLAITETIYGHKIYVDTRDISLAPHILMDGCWEQWITNVFRRAITPGMYVLDIGANIGWYSLIAADLIGPSGRLTSFEANPAMADIVHRNFVVNGFLDRARVEDKAVFSETKQLEFQVFERFLGSSSLFTSPETAASFRDTVKTLRVEAVSLDEFFPAGSRVDFIKIDAEGAEPHILKGAKRLLSENKQAQVMLEFAPGIIVPSYGSLEAFIKDIQDLGFSIWRIAHDSSLVLSSLDDLKNTTICDVILKR